MSVTAGMGCMVALGCLRWAWKRCTHTGSYDSAAWPSATPDEFGPIPRIARLILATYEPDLRHPQFPPVGGYQLNPDCVVKRVTDKQTHDHASPYLIYVDHNNREIVLAIRGLNLVKESDYKVLLDNRLGMQMFDGGYVHHGLLKYAIWMLNEESETLRRLWMENGSSYRMVFAGHSLGSGVAALLTVIAVNHLDLLGGVPRSDVRCYTMAPVRCMSLNLAVKYADVIHSVILQDDFLPRTPTPLEDIFQSIFCLPCLLFAVCLKDTFVQDAGKHRDPRRLYAPGRIYHIVERKFCRCGRYPPEVRTEIPVDGRFEHIVLSCNATTDHAIIWIEREAEKALQIMRANNSETMTTAPKIQKLERLETLQKELNDALERVVSLNIPHATEAKVTTEYEPSRSDEESIEGEDTGTGSSIKKERKPRSLPAGGTTKWDVAVKKLLRRNESSELLLKKETVSPRQQRPFSGFSDDVQMYKEVV